MTYSKRPLLWANRLALPLLITCYLAACSDGSDGSDGQNGTPGIHSGGSGLTLTTDEPAGANCPAGGVKVESGVDDNFNKILDADEIESTRFVCTPHLPEPASLSLTYESIGAFTFRWPEMENVTHYQLYEDADGNSGYSLVATIPNTDQSYHHVVPVLERLNAQYVLESCNPIACTISNVAEVTEDVNGSIGFFKASNADERDVFGQDLAISEDGNTMAISAQFEAGAFDDVTDLSDNGLFGAGATYIFNRIDGIWQQTAYLKADFPGEYDGFGSSLGMSHDGLTMVIGCPGDDSESPGVNGDASNNDLDFSGAAYVFVFRDGRWQRHSFLKAKIPGEDDAFGYSVDVNHDGTRIVIGASREDGTTTVEGDDSGNDVGAAYVFDLIEDEWQQTAYLKADNREDFDAFGFAVTISGDGYTVVSGAIGEKSAASGVNGDRDDNSLRSGGAGYVFRLDGDQWEQEAYIKASSPRDYDNFGEALSLNFDGDILAAGNSRDDSNVSTNGDATVDGLLNSGAVEIFMRDEGAWQHHTYLKAEVRGEFDQFGFAVDVSPDGSRLVVSALSESSTAIGINGNPHIDSSTMEGAAFVYKREGNYWHQHTYLKAINPGDGVGYGYSVFTNNAGSVVIGAPSEKSLSRGVGADPFNNDGFQVGAAYFY